MLKLAEYFLDQGLDVLVVCASTPYRDSFGYKDILSKIRTKTCHDPVASIAKRIDAPIGNTPKLTSTQPTLRSRLKNWVKPLALDMMVPDSSFLIVSSMVKAVEEELRQAMVPVTLITSGPPHSVHLAGRVIKKKHRHVKWVLDYRDSWNGTSLFRKKNTLLQKYNSYLERECLSAADHLTYISGPMLSKAEAIAGFALAGKSSMVSNGYDERFQSTVPFHSVATERPFRIGYFGALDRGAASYRDPSCVFAALDILSEGSIQFVVHGPSALDEEWHRRLGNRLLNGGKLPHPEAIRRMGEMDALLLLHTREDGADEVITGKVFEYISTGLPIISIGPREMAVNALLANDTAFHSVSHLDRDGIKALFTKLIQNHRAGQTQRRDQICIRAFSRTTQHEKFFKLIGR